MYVSALGLWRRCREEGVCDGNGNGGGPAPVPRTGCTGFNCDVCHPCEVGEEKEEGGKKYVCKQGRPNAASLERCLECCDVTPTWWAVKTDSGPGGGGDGGGGGGGGGGGQDITPFVIAGAALLLILVLLR